MPAKSTYIHLDKDDSAVIELGMLDAAMHMFKASPCACVITAGAYAGIDLFTVWAEHQVDLVHNIPSLLHILQVGRPFWSSV